MFVLRRTDGSAEQTKLHITLLQAANESDIGAHNRKSKLESIGISVFENTGEDWAEHWKDGQFRARKSNAKIGGTKSYGNGRLVSASMSLPPSEKGWLIVPSCFTTEGRARFDLNVYTTARVSLEAYRKA